MKKTKTNQTPSDTTQTATTPVVTAAEMRSLVLIFHDAFEADITRIIQRLMGVARYTKIRDVVGARIDAIAGTDYEPQQGQNNMLILVADLKTVSQIAEELKALRRKKGHGLRGYVTPVDDII